MMSSSYCPLQPPPGIRRLAGELRTDSAIFPDELRELLLDPSISDLMINGTTGVYADRNGVVELIPLKAPYTNDRLQAAIERVARLLGQDLTTQNPILNTRLPDGSRVAVVGPPSSINGPTLTIRKFNRWYTSDELIASGSMPERVRDTVVDFIGERKNGIISGGTGSGKTTLMKAFPDHIPEGERLLIIEQPAELKVLPSERRALGGRRCDFRPSCRHSERTFGRRASPPSRPDHHGRDSQ